MPARRYWPEAETPPSETLTEMASKIEVRRLPNSSGLAAEKYSPRELMAACQTSSIRLVLQDFLPALISGRSVSSLRMPVTPRPTM